MLVFIDESGDPGLTKLDQRSSKLFIVALVVFEDNEEAINCDKRIELFKKELGWDKKDEFHFKNNSHKVRMAFLKAVVPYNFFYYAIVMNKKRLWGEGFKDKRSFYKYACNLVFENAKEKLEKAVIVIDESGTLDFKRQLERYLKSKINFEIRRIMKVKMQRSSGNNLLQLADYIAGVVNRSMVNKFAAGAVKTKKSSQEYRKIISHREIYVQVWPK